MNLNWNLEEIYPSIESEKFQNDLENYKNQALKLNKWSEKNLTSNDCLKEKLEFYILQKNELSKYSMLSIYLNLLLSTDTSNTKVLRYIDIIETLEASFVEHEILFKQFLKNIENLEAVLNSSEILKEHSYIISELKKESAHTLTLEQEEIISKMQLTGSKSWKKLWESLTSNLLVDIFIDNEQKQLPLSVIRNYAYDKCSELRKKAYEAELKAYEKISEPSAYCLNNIKGEVITLSKLRNYNSPLEMTLENSRMNITILNVMLEAIKERIPYIRKYFNKKAKLLGHKNGLPFYDLFAPIGKSNLSFTYEEAQEYIIKNFTEFNEELGSFAKKAFKNGWIDVMPKKGKVGGAFCEAVHPIKQSRILVNFSGSFNDVLTLAHELGHAYHDTCLYDETELNSFYPMPIAETASTLCECIIINSALKTASEEEKKIILENDISGITQVIIDIYSRFIFEDTVFEKRKASALSLNELNEIMLDAQKKAYGNGLESNYLHKYMWICKPHYYDSDFNYYNFPYAFGLLLSKGLYSLYLKDKKKFMPLYKKMLNLTGKSSLEDVARICNINLYDKAFWLSALKLIEEEIEQF